MAEIRLLQGEQEVEALVGIIANAYPGMGLSTAEKRTGFAESIGKRHQEFAEYNLYGCFRDGELVGGMAMHDFEMSWFGETVLPVGGVGMVAVDLLHKKERIAYELLQFYIRHYRERGMSMAVLYPFRPDFYKKMGFGIGTKMNRYAFSPSVLPKGKSKERVVYLKDGDQAAVLACYERFARARHGMILRTADEASRLFPAGSPMVRVGVREGSELRGYMYMYFEKVQESNFILHNLIVREFVYETPEAMAEMLTFLQAQSDQFQRVIWNTQEEDFHHLLQDPRNGTDNMLPTVYHESNTQGVGVMYRVLNVADTLRKLEAHNFGGQTCQFQLVIEDSFLQEQTSLHLRLDNGKLTVGDSAGAVSTVHLAIEDFSSLLMGTVTFRSLYDYGAARLSDPALVSVLHRAFLPEEKPLCMTAF
jgi:predicted acetyltransferase